jgi:uncharacterized protein (TIGR03086 family)
MNMAEAANPIDLGPPARRLAGLVARIPDQELTLPTPCPAYALGDLIEHVGGLAIAFTAAAGKERDARTDQPPPGDAARLGADWRERIARDLKALGLAWQAPGAWLGMTRIAGMDTPAQTVGLVLADELAVHGWDVARATRQPYTCEPDVLEAARQFLEMFASPDAPSGPEVPFGPATALLPEAPLLDRVVALAGRDPGWSPPDPQPAPSP